MKLGSSDVRNKEGDVMDINDWFLLVLVLGVGVLVGIIIAPDPCMTPPGGFPPPFKHPGIGG